MATKHLNFVLGCMLIILSVLTGCQKTYDEPPIFEPVDMQANISIGALKLKYRGKNTPLSDTLIISGKVVSSDEFGNLYRTLYIQDSTGGIEVRIGRSPLFNLYRPGQTIFVKPINLVLGSYGGMVSIGAPDVSNNSANSNSSIEVQEWINRTIFRGKFGDLPTPKEVYKASDITHDMYGTLVTFKGVVFDYTKSTLRTWAERGDTTSSGVSQSFLFSDASTIVVRTSNYARFADVSVPFERVDITGILTRYYTTNQIILNRSEDVVTAR